MSAILLGIDLEDVRDWVKNGHSYHEAVPACHPSLIRSVKCPSVGESKKLMQYELVNITTFLRQQRDTIASAMQAPR
jgi:hypothetical protein